MPSPGAKQWVQFTSESAYGVTATVSPVIFWARLHSDNAFGLVPKPMRKEYMTADTRNRPAINVSSQYTLEGSLSVLAYADACGPDTSSFTDRMFDWATTIGSSGFTDDLASYTIRHFDGVRNREYLGCKVKSLKFSTNANTDQGVGSFAIDIVAQKMNAVDPATLVEPAVSVFPIYPYKHIETAGGVLLGLAAAPARVKYGSLELSIANDLKSLFYETAYLSDCPYNGRTVDMTLGNIQFASKTDRDNFEAQSAITATAVYTKGTPAHVLTLDMKANAHMTGLDRSMPLGDATNETIHLRAFYDTAASTDFSFTAT
jgi:hypothetical protein